MISPELGSSSRDELPSSGEILRAASVPDLDVEEYDQARAERYRRREGFY